MSCFIVNEKTATTIVTALVELQYIDTWEAQGFLNSMMNLNTVSVNGRYSETTKAPQFVYRPQKTGLLNDLEGTLFYYLSALQIVKLIAFYNYQTCDYDLFEHSLTKKVLDDASDDLTASCRKWLHKNYDVEQGFFDHKKYLDFPYEEKMHWGLFND